MRVIVVVMFVSLQVNVGVAADTVVDKARHFLEIRNRALRSFDVTITSTARRYFFNDPHDPALPNSPRRKIEYHVLPSGEEVTEAYRSRQVYLDDAHGVKPKRRVEQIGEAGRGPISLSTFDGAVRRSFYAEYQKGLIGGPSDAYTSPGAGNDYLEMCGCYYKGNSLLQYFEKGKLSAREDNGLLVLECSDTPEMGNFPTNGYKAWLDPSKEMSFKKFEHFQIFPSTFNGEPTTGDDKQYVVSTMDIDDFHSPVQGGYVPLKSSATLYLVRYKTPKEGGGVEYLKLYDVASSVDVNASSWNQPIDAGAFAFDFPPGTLVNNEFAGVDVVVGDSHVGRNIDDLLSKATRVVRGGRNEPIAISKKSESSRSFFAGRSLIVINAIAVCLLLVIAASRKFLRRS